MRWKWGQQSHVGRALALSACAALLAACASTSLPAPVATLPSRDTVTRTGEGMMSTDAFALSGDYRLDWTTVIPAGGICFTGLALMRGSLPDQIITSSRAESGTTYLYQLRTERYHLQVNANCPWSFSLVPQ